MTPSGPALTLTTDTPPIANVDGGTVAHVWIAERAEHLRAVVRARGALLVRGLPIIDPATVEQCASALLPELMVEREGFAPRQRIGRVHGSSEWPHNEPMCMHHELSYSVRAPGLLMFACLVEAASGGAVGLADAAAVARSLPPGIVDRFERTGWLLTRTYSPLAGIPVADAFGTDDRDLVSAYCRTHAIEHEWRPDGTLVTRQRRSALLPHPSTGELCWFNQIAFLNEYTMDADIRDYLRMMCGPDGLPFNTNHGDGAPIAETTIHTINATYDRHTRWIRLRAGDLLVVDNVRTAHARQAYRPPRQLLVAMGAPVRPATFDP